MKKFYNTELKSAGFRIKSGMTGSEEQGRSMVEMLGVLAVMGVLSVGGVAMYTSAMNKHRANELLNEASKRAVVVVPQIAMGNTPSIDEFTNPSDHNFELKGPDGTSAWKDTDKQFSITISGVSEAVCQQMKNVAGAVIKEFKPDTCADGATVILTYNNDMSTEDLPSTTVCSGHGYKNSNDACVCNPGYSGTDCATAACTTGTYCGSGATKECCATDEVCTTSGDVAGSCVKLSSGCTTNASCNDATKYCKLTGALQNDCAEITGGTCEPLDEGTSITYTHDGKTAELLSGDVMMSWWAADNWCKAHGKRLVKASTLGCTTNGTSGSCPSSVYSDMHSVGLSYYYWTVESYNSCRAWIVVAYHGFFDNSNKRNNYSYALCE